MKNGKKSKRYWVTNDNYIPISGQPNEGYTEMGAVLRAQREVERDIKMFGITLQEAKSAYHIMDCNCKIRHDLDNAI